jgi:hypothetical protein
MESRVATEAPYSRHIFLGQDEKQIYGREQFRTFFRSSPCIWAEEASLRLLRIGGSCEPHSELAADVVPVFTERIDQ